MNGLRYIRIRCNLTLGELANKLGVTRQALSSWESGKKKIPEQRKEQLTKFFGIDNHYFEEITEEEKKYLLGKAMFRYNDNGKETYRYKPGDGLENLHNTPMCFVGDSNISLSEEYVRVKQRKEKTLNKIDDIIEWTHNAGSLRSEMACITRGCNIYDMLNELMETARNMEPLIKMPFIFEIHNVLKAMLLAYGVVDEGSLEYLNKTDYHCGEDGEWVVHLSEEIKRHWAEEKAFHQQLCRKVPSEKKEQQKKDNIQVPQSIDDQIKAAEIENEKFRKEHPELADTNCFMVWGK